MRPTIRSLFLAALVTFAAAAQTIAPTQITGTLANADGSPFTGTLHISWPAYSIGQANHNAGSMFLFISGGAINIRLWPTDAMSPSGTNYSVSLQAAGKPTVTASWNVPSSLTPIDISTVYTPPTAPTTSITLGAWPFWLVPTLSGGALSVAASASLVAGPNVGITGPWPNQTVSSTVPSALGATTAPSLNGDIYVDGTTYANLNQAWTAVAGLSSGGIIRLSSGTYGITSQLTEPEQATGVSLIGAGSNVTRVQANATMTAMLYKAGTVQGNFTIQGVTFQCNSGGTVNAQYGMQALWARGVAFTDVQLQNCGTEDFAFGGSASGQSSGTFVNIQTDYNESVFTGPAGGSGPTPPAYGIHLYNNAYDSKYIGLYIRNAHTASLRIDATSANNSFIDVHGFGYASSGSLPYSQNYTVEDASGGNRFYDFYSDGALVSAIHLAMTGTSANDQFQGGTFFWPSGTTWPTVANFATLDSSFNDFAIRGFHCSGLQTTNLWNVSGSATANLYGQRVTFDNVTGCTQTMTYQLPTNNRNYNWSTTTQSGTFTYQGSEAHKNANTQNGTKQWGWYDKNSAFLGYLNDYGQLFLPSANIYGSLSGANLGTPAPTLSGAGSTGGSTTYSYVVQAYAADQSSHGLPSATVTTTAGQASLSSGSPIAISWTAITGAWSYKVFRTAGGSTQGQIASGGFVNATSLSDTGLSGDSSTASATNTSGQVFGNSYGTNTTCVSSASPAVCGAAPAGFIAIPTGTNPQLVVNTTVVTANSQLHFTSDQTIGTALGVTCNTSGVYQVYVLARTPGTSFKVSLIGTVSTNPYCLSYSIEN